MKKFIYKTLFIFLVVSLGHQVVAQDLVPLRITTPDGVIDWDIDAIKTSNDHGPQIAESVTGEIVKALDGVTEATDNDTWTELGYYCCESVVNTDEVAGKIAIISRGACIFSGKILNAQKAGAIAVIIANRAPIGTVVGTHNPGLITMAGTAPQSDSITIPAIFISYEDRVELEALMESGTVMGTIAAETLYDPSGPEAYHTPLSQVKPFNPQVIAYTRTSDTLFNVDFQVDITDPSGNTTTLTEPKDTLLPGKDWPTGTIHEEIIQFENQYTPTEVGTYTMSFTATTQEGTWPIDDAEAIQSFAVTEFTYAIDDAVVGDENGMFINDVVYLENTGIHNVGAYYRTGDAGATVTYASFAVANPGALDIGNGFDFTVNLYDIDADDDGIPDAELPAEPIASTVYSLDGTEMPNVPMNAPFPTPVTLDANSVYLMMVVSGGFSFTDVIPAYSTAGGGTYPGRTTAYQFGETFNYNGYEYWNGGSDTYPYGGRQVVARMQLEGFEPPVSVELLPEGLVEIFPTLTKDMVNIQFDLTENTPEVQMIVVSTEGRTMHMQEYNNVMNETIQLNVQNYPAGNYFVTIKTDKGVRTKKFVVAR
jgi:hypothetical protein